MAIELKNAVATQKLTIKNKTRLTRSKKIKASERMFFIEQLALMLETGNDLYKSLSILAQQNKNPVMANVINELAHVIAEGKPFSLALAEHPDIFSSTYVSLVAASESGGYLQRILAHLLDMEKQRDELRTTLIAAASYPAFLIVFSTAMVIFILAVVFPKFADLFAAIRNQLPITTLLLMSLSEVIIHYWWALSAGLAMLVAGGVSWARGISGQRLLDGIKMKTPMIRQIFIKIYLIQAMRVLGLSLKHGVNLLDALTITKDVVNNYAFHDFIDRLVKDINEGRKLALGFNEAKFIPPMVKQMITTGEETGNLALVCTRLADYFQNDLEKLLKFITKTIEPVMLIVMGLIVGVLVSSLILPIFKLSHAVH